MILCLNVHGFPNDTRRVRTLFSTHTHRVIGLQSGNAVDGIDVGIFDFEPVGAKRSAEDRRKVLGGLRYTTLANKTYSFTKEERDFVLELRPV